MNKLEKSEKTKKIADKGCPKDRRKVSTDIDSENLKALQIPLP